MAFFTIPILAPLAKALGIAGLFSTGTVAKAAQGIGIADRIRRNFAMDPNISLKARALANLPFGIGSLFQKPGTAEGGGGGGGGGGDGGTDASGRPFFDPGLGSPAQNLQSGGTGAQAGVQPVTTQPLAPPTDPTGGRVQAVTVENLPAPEPFDFGLDPALTDDGGFGFFNQGGLVSLLPRFQNGGEVSFRQRQGQRPLLGWDARRVESTPEQWDPDLFPGESEEIHPTRDEDLVPSERLGTVSRDWQEKAADISTALATTGVLGNTASQALWPVTLAHGLWKQLNMDPNTSGWDRMRDFVPLAKYVLPEKGYRVAGSPFWPTSKKPTPFFDPGFGSPPPPPPGEGSPPPPPSPESHAADRVSLPGIPSEADFSAGFDFGTDFGFNQGGLVSLLPRFFGGGEVSGDLFGGGNEVSGWDMGSWADKQMSQDTGSTGDDLGDQARGMGSPYANPTPPPILQQPKPLPTTYDTLHDVVVNLEKGIHWDKYTDIQKQVYKDKYLPYGPEGGNLPPYDENSLKPSRHGIYSENNIGRFPGIDLKEGGFFDEQKLEPEEKAYMDLLAEKTRAIPNLNPEVIHKDALDYIQKKAGQYTLPDVPNVIFGTDPRITREMRQQYLESQGLKETHMDGKPTLTYIKRKGRSI